MPTEQVNAKVDKDLSLLARSMGISVNKLIHMLLKERSNDIHKLTRDSFKSLKEKLPDMMEVLEYLENVIVKISLTLDAEPTEFRQHQVSEKTKIFHKHITTIYKEVMEVKTVIYSESIPK